MSDLSDHRLSAPRLLLDLKLCGDLLQRLSEQHSLEAIAACITNGLVEQFGCAFARIWTVNGDRSALKLIASSGLYTRLDGSFATVPMGSFKVGKIAQHCIPFLSNQLPDESWVKDRDWAIAKGIQGFAGLPLMVGDQAIGVLALFSKTPLSAEFLEVLQILSVATTEAIARQTRFDAAMAQQQSGAAPLPLTKSPTLSEQLSELLGRRLSLLGTEEPLPEVVQALLVKAAQLLKRLPEQYGRLIYEAEAVSLECMAAAAAQVEAMVAGPEFGLLTQQVEQLGGSYRLEAEGAIAKLLIQLPRRNEPMEEPAEKAGSGLSEREQEVIELLAEGCRDREVAERLYISERTVKFHVKNILAKLDVRTRIQAVYLATKQEWLQ